MVENRKFSKRDFLRATAITGAAVSFWLSPLRRFVFGSSAKAEGSALTSTEIVHDIEVYGLGQPISNQSEIDALYEYFNSLFSRKLSSLLENQARESDSSDWKTKVPANRWEERDLVLDPNKRYLEVVVPRSIYEEFLANRDKNGVDFVEWIKLHVEVLNLMIEKAKPAVPLEVKLSRILVVEDSFRENPSGYDKNIDGSWLVNRNPFDPADWQYPLAPALSKISWDEQGNIVIEGKNFFDWIKKDYAFIAHKGFFSSSGHSLIYMPMIHEWGHIILNFPDEYIFNIISGPLRFPRMYLDTGYLNNPEISPYLGLILQKNHAERIRGYYTHPEGIGYMHFSEKFPYGFFPGRITLSFKEVGFPTEGKISVWKGLGMCSYYEAVSFGDSPFQEETNRCLLLDRECLSGRLYGKDIIYPTSFYISLAGRTRIFDVYLPSVAFNMSKLAGNEEANYVIEFSGYDDPSKDAQLLKIVDEQDLDGFMKQSLKNNDIPYALMRVSGTASWFVWFLR